MVLMFQIKKEQHQMLGAISLKSWMNYLMPSLRKSSNNPLDIPRYVRDGSVKKSNKYWGKNSFNSIFRDVELIGIIFCHSKQVTSKEEFITATPLIRQNSQGILQSIFEYQTMICS